MTLFNPYIVFDLILTLNLFSVVFFVYLLNLFFCEISKKNRVLVRNTYLLWFYCYLCLVALVAHRHLLVSETFSIVQVVTTALAKDVVTTIALHGLAPAQIHQGILQWFGTLALICLSKVILTSCAFHKILLLPFLVYFIHGFFQIVFGYPLYIGGRSLAVKARLMCFHGLRFSFKLLDFFCAEKIVVRELT